MIHKCISRHVRFDLYLSRVMSYNFNLNPHIILAESRYPNTCPNRLVVRHPFLEIPHHRLQGFVVDRDVVRVHPKYLLPPFSSGVLQVQVHVGESLVDLRIDLPMDHRGLWIPTTFSHSARSIHSESEGSWLVYIPWPAHSMRSPMRTAWL